MVYWGQQSYRNEERLSEYCKGDRYDVFVVGWAQALSSADPMLCATDVSLFEVGSAKFTLVCALLSIC